MRSRLLVLLAVGTTLAPVSAGCGKASAPERTPSGDPGPRLPDALGPFHAVTAAAQTRSEVHGNAVPGLERTYELEGREARLRVVDTLHARQLKQAFRTALGLEMRGADELLVNTVVQGEPAFVQWSHASGESELEVLACDRYLVSVKVWPTTEAEEAKRLVPGGLHALLGCPAPETPAR
ncbi:MAG: hypothetical protein U0230_05340 [Polyangiales bacterium]